MTPAAGSNRHGDMKPPSSGVKTRMYRLKGLGDCFLLAFRTSKDGAYYVLIDCGVFLGTPAGSERMKAIARDIEQATAGRIDVLVVTHEHWDHLSGFTAAREVFDRLKVGEVWFAWTEDPSDRLARRLRQKRNHALQALSAAVARLRPEDEAQAEAFSAVLSFAGDYDGLLGLSKTSDLVDYARGKSPRRRYLRPGQATIEWDGVPGVRTFVLGPPRNERLLSKSDPAGDDGEAYVRATRLNEANYFYSSALGSGGGPPEDLEGWRQALPFDRPQSIEWGKVQDTPYAGFFRAKYGFGDLEGEGPRWRRIDSDWLGEAGRLALQLDNDTNNTSLVLAIELVPSGKVLLFPGDAQTGNWLSWEKLSWQLDVSGRQVQVTAHDLVGRTVLYKVGHHGSHNATLRDKGLELMESGELVAMVPVDEDQAQGKGWAMPYPPLLERLLERTRGRVIRSDKGLPGKPDDVPGEDWDRFLSGTAEATEEDLWVEYLVAG